LIISRRPWAAEKQCANPLAGTLQAAPAPADKRRFRLSGRLRVDHYPKRRLMSSRRPMRHASWWIGSGQFPAPSHLPLATKNSLNGETGTVPPDALKPSHQRRKRARTDSPFCAVTYKAANATLVPPQKSMVHSQLRSSRSSAPPGTGRSYAAGPSMLLSGPGLCASVHAAPPAPTLAVGGPANRPSLGRPSC